MNAPDLPPDLPASDLPVAPDDPPTRRDMLREDPQKFGFLTLMRELERGAPDKPRIGLNATLNEEIATLGQDPFMSFPVANISHYEEQKDRPPRIRSRFLGYFGPQGALPMHITVEAYHWYRNRDDAFVAFTDMITGRFQQLFFRAWSDARGITQYDHPADDRGRRHVGAFVGLASPALQDRGAVPDLARVQVAGLALGRIKSPVRLRQILEKLLGVGISVEEHVPIWMSFEPGDQSRIGQQGASLGRDCRLGARVQSVNEKIRIHVRTETRPEYESFLPGGAQFERLRDLLFWYLGSEVEVDIAPALPATAISGVSLGGAPGQGAALGWTAWMAPPPPAPGAYLGNAVFAAERGSG